MKEEFNLSDKITRKGNITKENVREFIKRLKEKIKKTNCDCGRCNLTLNNLKIQIDVLAGEKLR